MKQSIGITYCLNEDEKRNIYIIYIERLNVLHINSQVSSSAADPPNTVGETEGVGIGLGIVSLFVQ